jgi:uncharacterized RDD family membrane protein YckC
VSDEQIVQLFRTGKINAGTLVWHEGMLDWLSYEQAGPEAAAAPAPTAVPPITGGEASPNEPEVVCAECGKLFPRGETVQFGKASVCAACKPVFLQKLSEGAWRTPGELVYASVWTRFAALFLDGLLLGAVNMAINFAAGFIFAAALRPAANTGLHATSFLLLQSILMFLNISVGVTYEGLMVGTYGATLGKMACKIKVVTADGGKVGYARAFGRYFAKLLSSLTCFVGFIIACFDDQKRALHDHICNTRVLTR